MSTSKSNGTNGFEFVDDLPPGRTDTTRSKGRLLREFAAALQDAPGRWAKYPLEIAQASTSTRACDIRRGRSQAFRAGQYETTVRDGVLYVRAVEA